LLELINAYRSTSEADGTELVHDRAGRRVNQIAPDRDLYDRAIAFLDVDESR